MKVIHRATDDGRTPAAGHANYQGNVVPGLDFTRAMGPTYMGELVWPVAADYDAETDRTRVGFSLIPPTAEAVAS